MVVTDVEVREEPRREEEETDVVVTDVEVIEEVEIEEKGEEEETEIIEMKRERIEENTERKEEMMNLHLIEQREVAEVLEDLGEVQDSEEAATIRDIEFEAISVICYNIVF